MALSRSNEFDTGSTLTETKLEGEFDNIYNNALSLISPLTGNLAAGGNTLTGLGLGVSTGPALQFTGDTNTGVYSSGADALDLAAGGLDILRVTSTPTAGIVNIDPGAISATASTSVGRVNIDNTSALTIPTGTTAIAASLFVAEPNLTATGTVTDAATVYIQAAPTEGGTSNTALWVDSGTTRLDGSLDLQGGQIAFPATQSASAGVNTLDDYEEGSWTPVLTFATAGDLSVVYTAQVGRYVKVGRIVVASFRITTSTFTHTTASGTCLITGMPFASVNVTNLSHIGSMVWGGITKASYTNVCALMLPNVSQLQIFASGSGQTLEAVAAGSMPTGGTVDFISTISYLSAD